MRGLLTLIPKSLVLMSQYPTTEWSGSRVISTVIATAVPFFIALLFFGLRLRSNLAIYPILWGFLFFTAAFWGLLGAALPVALDGVYWAWWILPLLNLIFGLLPFLRIRFTPTMVGIILACLLAAGTITQYAIAQRSWLAVGFSIPYLIWCLIVMWGGLTVKS